MARLAYDLHIHSALSPCAENDMSPYNIAAMASIKGLDIIALTDHNSSFNAPPLINAAEGFGITCVPAMEATSIEDVHVLCYFPSIKAALEYSSHVYSLLPDIPVKGTNFGDQILIGDDDEETGRLEKLLITAAPLTVKEIFTDVRALGGECVFAHIDKPYNGVLAMLGMMPLDIKTNTVEVSVRQNPDEYIKKHLKGNYKTIVSSDAHALSLIAERERFLELSENTPECFIEWLKSAN